MTQQNEAIRLAIKRIQDSICPTCTVIDDEFVERMEGRISEHDLHLIISALRPLLDQTSAGVGDDEVLELLRKLTNVASNYAPEAYYAWIQETSETIGRALTQADKPAPRPEIVRPGPDSCAPVAADKDERREALVALKRLHYIAIAAAKNNHAVDSINKDFDDINSALSGSDGRE